MAQENISISLEELIRLVNSSPGKDPVFYGTSMSRMGGYGFNTGGYRYTGTFDRQGAKNLSKEMEEIRRLEKDIADKTKEDLRDKNLSEEELKKEIKIRQDGNEKLKKAYNQLKNDRMLNEVMSFIINTVGRVVHLAHAYQAKEFEIIRAQLNATQKLVQEQISLSSNSFNTSFSTVLNTLEGNVREIGKNALTNQMQLSKQFWQYERDVPLEMRKLSNQSIIANEKFTFNEVIPALAEGVGDVMTFVNRLSNGSKPFADAMENGSDIAESLAQSEEYAENIRSNFNLIDDATKNIINPLIEMRKASMELDTETREILNSLAGGIMDETQAIVDKFNEMAQRTTNMIYDIDKETKKVALEFGFTGRQAQAMAHAMIEANLTAAKWGLEVKDLLAMQSSYMENASRQVMMSNADFDLLAATSRITGIESGQIGSLVGDMNIFNTSIEHGTDNITAMYHLANKMGLSSKQFTKDLGQNLKLAQKYNFVGGSKAMERMSIWSQQVRMNLATATSFAESLISGGIESTLEKAAQLQVLGGNAAIYSDPLGMMYDAGADTESLARRMVEMVGNYGTLDRKTGETTFSWTDTAMITQIAKALGMDRGEAMNMLREKNKYSVVSRQLTDASLTEEQKKSISNRATYDDKTGKFKVTYIGADGEKHDKFVENVTAGDLEFMQSQDKDEALIDFAQRSLDVETKQLAVTKAIAAQMGIDVEKDFYRTQAEKELILRQNSGNIRTMGVSTYGDIMRLQNEGLQNDYNAQYAAWNSGLVKKSMEFQSSQMAQSVERVTRLNAEFEETTRLLVGDERELYAAALRLARLTGNKDLIRSIERAQTNFIENEKGDAGLGRRLGQQILGAAAPVSNSKIQNDAFGYNNMMGVQNFRSYGGHGFDRKYDAVLSETSTAVTSLSNAINTLSSRPIQTNSKVQVNGSLNLQQPGYGVTNLINELQKNPTLMNEFINLLSNQTATNVNGGKSNGSISGVARN